ncbi:MAG: terminase [Magnetococcales bacterium]|nr:terminase [Magnetococcales bacterium]
MWSRQTGKTFATTLEAVLDVLAAESTRKKTRWTILSISHDRAKDAIEDGVKRHLSAARIAFEAMELPFTAEETVFEVRLAHGSRIRAISANPVTARGMSENLILDEFAHHKDSRKIWAALFPVISRPELKIRVISTPNGKGNRFYELMTSDDPLWTRHVVDIHQAVKEGLPRDIEELKCGIGDPDAWAQEFELQWLDEASAWLSFDLIDAVEENRAGVPENYTGGPCFVGVDIAARNDLFVIWVLEAVGDVLWTREIIARRRISFQEQDALLDEVFRRYRVTRCAMDQTGMGEKPVEDAKRRHGSVRVEGVLFTSANKLTLATEGKEAFEDRKIRIPQGDITLREDLHRIKKTVGPTGVPRFLAESDSQGHADRAWACFLAVHAAAMKQTDWSCLMTAGRRATAGRWTRGIFGRVF